MNNYCVYKHTSPSGKVYVGITNRYYLRELLLNMVGTTLLIQ